jgi:ubiquinone biosynthesis accessory factor UbiJ
VLSAPIQNLMNRGLPRSPRARQLCNELLGKRIAIDVRGVARYVVESLGPTLSVTRAASAAADAEIRGGPAGLWALGGENPEAAMQRGDVQILGDAQVAEKFRELALLLRPDVEEELALLIGDVPAHQLGRMARATTAWGRKALGTAMTNFAEYFAHERGDLVSRAEGDQFLAGVDALREDVDRLEARIQLLSGKSRQ